MFPADYTLPPYANTPAATAITPCFEPAWRVGAGLCADPRGHAADRAVHRGEGQTDHAVGLGNVVRAGLVAVDVTIRVDWLIRER